MRMVRVSVDGDRNNPIQGFLIQARLGIYEPGIGSFINITENANVKYLDCSLSGSEFSPESSVTHADTSNRENLVFYWQPPKTITTTKNVTFYATLAKNKHTFWVMEESDPVSLVLAFGDTETTITGSSISVSSSEGVEQTTKKVMSSTTPTKNNGPIPASFNISMISILLVIVSRISLAI
ncbi:uncharacterized protein LOC114541444 [Dendronephthya gigantea]|uniref:uncharacterized protein LOC114541444 n=1 Tax=Dendronephthya gigantea TaxID=151771 RepID=UPI00106AA991|nr:uncharacterized protein LOC114541444 [Dendronephthya gigantea]